MNEVLFHQLIQGAKEARDRANLMDAIAATLAKLQASEPDAMPELAKILIKHGICLIDRGALLLVQELVEHAQATGEHNLSAAEMNNLVDAVERSMDAK